MFRSLPRTLFLALLLALPGAHAASAGSAPATKDPRATARAAMKADLPYMAAKVRAAGKEPLRLNLADDVQYRFLRNRLAAAGKTPKSAPRLLAEIQGLRRQHLRGLGLDEAKVAGEEREELHILADVSEQNGLLTGTAHTTTEGGTFYTYLDVALWEGPADDLAPLGELGIVEQFDEGVDVFAHTQAPRAGAVGAAKAAPRGCTTQDTLKCQLKDGAFSCTYLDVRTCTIEQGSLVVQAPRETVTSDGVVTVCLDRSWMDSFDCDYKLEETGGHLVLPLRGRAHFPRPILKDASGMPIGSKVDISLSLPTEGGGCRPSLTPEQFWAPGQFGFFPDGEGEDLVWDLEADFGPRCFRHQERVHLNFSLGVRLQNAPGQTTQDLATVFLTSKSPKPSNNFLPIRFAYSCLAAGTRIQLPDGSTSAVEAISSRQSVLSRPAGASLAGSGLQLARLPEASLTVVDRSIGIERLPMVRLTTAGGQSLLLTEGHPVFTDRGPVLARRLRQGDVVLTESGPSRLVEVGREPYAGKVYNLKLGTGDELAAFPDAGISMFANGILVGDGNLQARLQDEADRRPEPTLEQIPRAWRKDFRNGRRATAKR